MADFLSNCFSGKRIVLIGCAQGHGYSVAAGCARNGADLLMIDHNPAIAEAAASLAAAGHRVAYKIADATQPDSIKSSLAELVGEGAVDGVVYLPRARVRKNWTELTPEDWHADVDTALSGAFFCIQAVYPYLCRSTQGPFVITLSSVLAGLAGNESAGYHSAKAGLESLTRYLAVQLGPQGIRANAIQMGWLIKDKDLPRFNGEDNRAYRESAIKAHPLRRIGYAEDLINTILFLGTERSAFMTGQILCLDGGLTLQEHTHFASRMNEATSPHGN